MLCGAPSFTFVAVCLRLYDSHFLYFNVLRPHILLISIFLCLFGAPSFFHFFFSFLNFDAPICLSYILPFLLSHRPYVLYYFAFLFLLCGAHSFTFVAVCLRLYIPIFAILALLSFLLQFLSFKSLSICHLFFIFLSLSFHFMSPFPFFVSFSFLFSFSFPFPFLLFPPSSLSSSSFWRPFWSLFCAPLWPPGVQAHAMHPPRYATVSIFPLKGLSVIIHSKHHLLFFFQPLDFLHIQREILPTQQEHIFGKRDNSLLLGIN